MPLTQESAARKDRTNATGATFEHRHFAALAGMLKKATFHGFNREQQRQMVDMFAHELAKTNPRFDRKRFLLACDVGELV